MHWPSFWIGAGAALVVLFLVLAIIGSIHVIFWGQ